MTQIQRPYAAVATHQGRLEPTPRTLRVPWVAQWTEEVSLEPVQPFLFEDGVVGIRYPNEKPDDRVLDVLWMRTDIDRGGTPQFAQLNVHRQRDAMIYQLCQVCGLPAGDSWLIPPVERVRSGPIQTSTPPTCERCVPLARRQCPQLNVNGKTGMWLSVRNHRLFAVWGDIVEFINGQPIRSQGELRLVDPRVRTNILGRQLVVEIYDYRRRR